MRLRLLLTLLTLGACARARPTHVPTMADAALSPDDDCAAFDSPELTRRLDRRTHSLRRDDNAVELLVDGVESWARRLDNTKDADLILVKTFIYSDDEAGQAVSSLLRARARAGATVIVQYDIKGSLGGLGELVSSYDASASDRFFRDKPILAAMAKDGVVVVPTNVPKRGREARRFERARQRLDPQASRVGLLTRLTGARDFGHFDHEKYWITGHREDGGGVRLAVIMGGLNIASEYAYGGTAKVDAVTGRGGWRDTDIELRGPVTLDVLARYVDLLTLNDPAAALRLRAGAWSSPQAAAGAARVRFVWNQPALVEGRRIEHLFRELIAAVPTGGTVRLGMAYFTPGRRIRRPIEAHLRDAGKLAVLTNSFESTDMRLVVTGSRGAYQSLLKTSPSAALFEWLPRPDQGLGTLHSKVASFGTCGPVVVGSANMDGLSSEHNSESVVVVEDAALRRRFDDMFEADIAQGAAQRVTEGTVNRTGPLVRWTQRGVYRWGWTWLSR